jgi:tetratricopeptide (TPR) repeat protein
MTDHTLALDDRRLPYFVRLLRPFLDLGPLQEGPLLAQGIDFAYESAMSPDVPAVFWQLHVSGALRGRIVAESGLREYDIEHPRDLPERLRSPRWQRMVELLDEAHTLDASRMNRLCVLLQSLGLYRTIETLPSAAAPEVVRTELAYAQYKLAGSRDGDAHAVLLEDAVLSPSKEPRHRLLNALFLVVASARRRHVDDVRKWRAVSESLHCILRPEHDPADALIESTYWRALSFLPYLCGDRAATTKELDLAETFGRSILDRGAPVDRWTAAYNMHPLLETRTKEALWCSDRDLALARTEELVARDPFDAKVHIELGDLFLDRGAVERALTCYQRGAEIGVPYTPFARFMIGHCLEALGDVDGALEAYVAAVELDHAAITPAQRLAELAQKSGRIPLRAWANDVATQRMRQVRAVRSNPVGGASALASAP